MAEEASFGIAEVWGMLRLGAGPAAFAGLYGLFAKLEDIASPEAKRDIAAWLKRAEIPGTLVNWPSQFAALFDRVFGERPLSWQCFFRSCVASLASVVVINAIWFLLRPHEAAFYFSEMLSDTIQIVSSMLSGDLDVDWVEFRGRTVPVWVVLVLVYNLVPDYVSLLKSRSAIGIISQYRSRLLALFVLILDVFVSLLIFVVIGSAVSLPFFMEWPSWSSYYNPFEMLIDDYRRSVEGLIDEMMDYGFAFSSPPYAFNIGVYLYTSLFTTIWIWLYVLSAGAVRHALRLQPVLRVLKWFLDIDGKPIRSIGVVVGLIAAVFWWGVILLGSFGSSDSS